MKPITRRVHVGSAVGAAAGVSLWRCTGVVGGFVSPERWREWVKTWQWMEALAKRRGWEVKALTIAPPISEASLDGGAARPQSAAAVVRSADALFRPCPIRLAHPVAFDAAGKSEIPQCRRSARGGLGHRAHQPIRHRQFPRMA